MEIELKQLSFGYRQQTIVLNDLTFSLADEEVVAMIGSSGSGKSTFLRILAGIIIKSSGNYFDGDIRVDKLPPLAYAQKGLTSFMFQEAALFPHLSVFDNIRFRLSLDRMVDSDRRVAEVLDLVGLSGFSGYLPKELSGGMKARVELARCFANRPELLLLDEPFGSLDIRWRWKLYKEIELLKRHHPVKILLVTHDIQEALLLADRVIVLNRNGQLQKDIKLEKWKGDKLTPLHLNSVQPLLADLQELILKEDE